MSVNCRPSGGSVTRIADVTSCNIEIHIWAAVIGADLLGELVQQADNDRSSVILLDD